MGIVSSQEMETYLKQNFDLEINQDLVTYREYINKLLLLEKIIFSIDKYNVQKAIESTMKLFIKSFPFSWHFIMCRLIFASFISQNKDTFLIFNYLMLIEKKEEEMFDQSTDRILHVFTQFVLSSNTRESDYILQKMNEQNLIDQTIIKRKKSLYFAQHLSDKTINKIKHNGNNYIYQDLIQEVKKDDWELHKKHIKEGHNPNEIAKIIRNDEIEKLQEISTQNDFNFNQRIAPSLYERCSFINQRNITLIDYAAFFSAVKCFKYLLMNGANIDNTGKYAIAGGNLEIIHLCEQNHALMEDSYETAIEFHRNDIFYYLYENKIKEVKNLTYLVINCIKYDNYEIFSFLENEGIEVDIFIINEAARNGNIFFVNYFLAGKTYPKNLFFLSLESGNIEFIRYLLEKKGLNVNEKNNRITPLMLCSHNNHIEIVKLLLEQEGIDINAKDKYGETALMYAASNGNVKIAKLLLEKKGIDINAKDDIGRNILFYTAKNIKMMKLILKQKGININEKDRDGESIFIKAIKNGEIDMVKFLLEQRDIDISVKDWWRKTTLILASENGSVEIVKLILEQKRIDINAKDKDGETALMRASENGHIEIVKLLLEQEGIDIDAKNDYGHTALIFASDKGHTEIVKLLLEQEGIDINAKNNDGYKALACADKKGYADIVKLFLKPKDFVSIFLHS